LKIAPPLLYEEGRTADEKDALHMLVFLFYVLDVVIKNNVVENIFKNL